MTEDELQKKILEHELKLALLEERNKNLESKLSNLQGGINRGLWILGGGFIAAFATWVMNGGMSSFK